MHQLILTKVGGPHPYVDPAPEKVGGQLTPWTPWLRGPWLGIRVDCSAVPYSSTVSFMSATSWSMVGSSIRYNLRRTSRRKNASILCLSDAVVNPHHAEIAWRILATQLPYIDDNRCIVTHSMAERMILSAWSRCTALACFGNLINNRSKQHETNARLLIGAAESVN